MCFLKAEVSPLKQKNNTLGKVLTNQAIPQVCIDFSVLISSVIHLLSLFSAYVCSQDIKNLNAILAIHFIKLVLEADLERKGIIKKALQKDFCKGKTQVFIYSVLPLPYFLVLSIFFRKLQTLCSKLCCVALLKQGFFFLRA